MGTSALLIDQPVVAVQPALVRALESMPAAAVLQQIHYRLSTAPAWEIDGEEWAAITYDELAAETGLSPSQAKRAVERLAEHGYIDSCQPEAYNRRKSYRIRYEVLQRTESSGHETPASDHGDSGVCSTFSQRSEKDHCATREASDETLFTPPAREEPEKRERPRDPIWDGLATVYPVSTSAEASRMGKVVKQLRALDPEPDEGLCRRAAHAIRVRYPDSSVMAVPNHWTWALEQRGVLVDETDRAGPVDPPTFRRHDGPTPPPTGSR